MKTRLILTLLLILLAAVIAAAAIFFLLARPVPPADTGAGSPAPPSAGPSLTIVAETITDKATGQPLTGDVCLNGTLLRALGKSVLRPQHYAELGNKRILFAENHSLYSKFVVFQIRCSVSLPGNGPHGRLGRDPRGCAGL
jgi:hypothetical protein